MKEIAYKLTNQEVLSSLVDGYLGVIEDGHWTLQLIFETTPSTIPQLISQQVVGAFPGIISRVIGMRLIQVPTSNENTVTVKDGRIYISPQEEPNGVDRNQSGSLKSSQSPGENSQSAGKSRPRTKQRR